MAEQSNLSEGDKKLYDKIAKLLNLANKNPNSEEATSAAAMAQKLIVQYNLDVAMVGQAGDRIDGRREEMKVEGGFYQYQRDLYKAVAELNFCFHFVEIYYVKRTADRTRTRTNAWGDKVTSTRYAGSSRAKRRHRLIGKAINTAGTRVMCEYLLQAVERLTQDRLRKSDGTVDQTQLLSRSANSFREGAVANVVERISQQQEQDERARKAKAAKAQREAQARAGQGSTATSLTLADVRKSEHEANYDFMYGDGAWAKSEAEAKDRAAQRRRDREEYAAWAKANPEEAAKREKEANKGRRQSWGRAERERPKDYGAFNAGYEVGSKISLHRQADQATPAPRLGKK